MEGIGGFFDLEIPRNKYSYHSQSLALNTGRACIHQIIKIIKPKKLWIPFYCCDAVISPLLETKTPFSFYRLSTNLDPELPQLGDGEFIMYTDFFGLKNSNIESLINLYGKKLILDRTHAFFRSTTNEIWSFTVCRKYFGVPDGAYLMGPNLPTEKPQKNKEVNVNFNVNRLIGNQDIAYRQYSDYEASLTNEIKEMSLISELLLSNVKYKEVARKRRENFLTLDKSLGIYNNWNWKIADDDVPFCYPFWPKNKPIEHRILHKNRFFVPIFWKDVYNRKETGFSFEKQISKEMLPLPIDHRYGVKELQLLIDFLIRELN